MTAGRQTVQFTDPGEAADLAAFLGRLLRYDRAAAVRIQASGTALAVFGRPPSFEVLAIRTARLAKPYEHGLDEALDVTVSAGDLLESIDERAATAVVPEPVTGPPWAGLLPPRGGWRPQPGLPAPRALRRLVAGVIAEFRARTEELGEDRRTRTELDRIGEDIWSRPVGDTDLPVRAAHAAQALGFLPGPAPGGHGDGGTPGEGPADQGPDLPGTGNDLGTGNDAGPAVTLLATGAWLRLRTPYGSVAVRKAGTPALSVTPA
ncbi:hypothetical protein [Streptomyces sp. TS71-3]|uniref:hypothetical protein n=1 Tax=Streptomyces sp. TS71-3 TaxID=2733862 RepID=UPI001B244F69|nr:hypothetical protein [Streptomyces sp. TS71-3]GHJ37555.1 hypothetical protein Sm713_31640 [Streptomyces sp. TS71-3]